jgi:hypothetical protein
VGGGREGAEGRTVSSEDYVNVAKISMPLTEKRYSQSSEQADSVDHVR